MTRRTVDRTRRSAFLKEGFGWSDEQLFEAVRFNLLVRRALGLVNLTDEVPVESTYYLFKQRLYRYQLETGSNLVYEVFQELTGDQAKRLGVVGEKLRRQIAPCWTATWRPARGCN